MRHGESTVRNRLVMSLLGVKCRIVFHDQKVVVVLQTPCLNAFRLFL